MPIVNGQRGPAFQAGDARAAENPLLASLHTVWVREHNRLADEISAADSSLNDEQIYQKARTTVMALIQNITYNEFLPALLGDGQLKDYEGYYASTDAGINTEFATAAFRIGHTMISDSMARTDANGNSLGDVALKDAFFNTGLLKGKGGIDAYLRGASQLRAEEIDNKVVDGVRDFLLSKATKKPEAVAEEDTFETSTEGWSNGKLLKRFLGDVFRHLPGD